MQKNHIVSKNKPLVSVIITSKNEENNIKNCLESIKNQSYPEKFIEIIIVDNNSTDKTKEVSNKYSNNIYNFGPERSAQRNFGIFKKATGKYVIYLDADMILSSVLIEKSVEELEKGNIVALYIPEIILGGSYWSKVRRFERSFYDGTVIDCARIIKTDIFKKTKGFDEKMTGPEDWDLDKKIRSLGKAESIGNHDFSEINNKLTDLNCLEINFIDLLNKISPNALIFHNEAKFNLKKYLMKKSYYSKSFDTYIQKWGKNDPDIIKQFGFWYRYFGVFFENNKWKRILNYPELFLGMIFLRFLTGIVFLRRKL